MHFIDIIIYKQTTCVMTVVAKHRRRADIFAFHPGLLFM